MNYKILGVNGGNGVILYPFRKNLTGNIEPRSIFHTPEDKQWRLNFKAAQDKFFVEYAKSQVDVIVGAPDCGHSSALSYSRAKQLSNPKENTSFQTFVNCIKFYQPKYFLMENLPKLLDNFTDFNKEVFPDYRLIMFNESVSKWGNSQMSRIRLVVIGVHRDLDKSIDDKIKLPDDSKFVYKTSGEIRKGLNEPDGSIFHLREPLSEFIPLYYEEDRKITARKARDIWNNEFKGLKRWEVNKGNLTTQPGIYRNLDEDYPLTVRKQNRQFNQDGLMLTPREIARIQGVPDSFKLWYEPDQLKYCLNKARATLAKTPPHEIGEWFYKLLDNKL